MDTDTHGLLVRVSRQAMACEFEVCFPQGRYARGTQWAVEALDLVESLEDQLSYFRPASQIARINETAATEAVALQPALFRLLQLAMKVCAENNGAYDITAAPLWEVWGFARRAGGVPSDAELAEARTRVGSHLVDLDPVRQTIFFRRSGVRINLGSIGKGYALDVCGEHLRAHGMTDFLLHAGQSSVLATGQCSPWEIGLRHPCRPEARIGILRLCDRALGTTAAQFQFFRHQGRRYGHVLDPRSGQPADGVLSATVVAPTAALADALSTAFYVLGPERSLAYCQGHPEIGMVMFCPSDRGQGVKTTTAGWKEGELTLCEN